MGKLAQEVLQRSLSQEILQTRLGDRLEQVFPAPERAEELAAVAR